MGICGHVQGGGLGRIDPLTSQSLVLLSRRGVGHGQWAYLRRGRLLVSWKWTGHDY